MSNIIVMPRARLVERLHEIEDILDLIESHDVYELLAERETLVHLIEH